MSAAQPATQPIFCDGCTRQASPEHLRQRIARLEWASRFRPIHISTLLLTLAPPAVLEDFFYYPLDLPRGPRARAFFEDLTRVAGASAIGDGQNREAGLAAFQRCGFYLASCIECPVEGSEKGSDTPPVMAKLIPSLVLRIRRSYRPQSVLLLSDALAGLGESLVSAGLDRGLLLAGGVPVPLPEPDDDRARGQFREKVFGLVQAPPSA